LDVLFQGYLLQLILLFRRSKGYKGLEVGQELNLGPGGVSVALRRGESTLRERPEMKEEILGKLVPKVLPLYMTT
jgi:hypothetical protein